ncbi:MAG: NAD(P)-dependent glycerol-3-phosphate dehydrogenase [Deltaproteobacteria bacterium]|nr:NAD(P)-dependent glycerol-3-phosphate dehydrogenase [Deltaproteobacteria bacterium]
MTGRIAVIGAGSWGTALAHLLAGKGFGVDLWVFEEELFAILERRRENETFLPGLRLPGNIRFTRCLKEALSGKSTAVCAVPSPFVREVFRKGRPHLEKCLLLISATKGLEEDSHLTPSQVLREVLGPASPIEVACLSGPSFAREVSRQIPTAVAAAGTSAQAARQVQVLFNSPFFRVYTNSDLLGVELGGAIKNVMAIAAGTADGLGFGHSSRAALITRGLAEMIRLGERLGAKARTFSGLAGLGDLVLTCTGELSRNRRVGLELGKGRSLAEILGEMKMVAEGVRTTKALYELSREKEVEMPITEKIYEILYRGKDPMEAVKELMSRHPRSEQEEY